METIVTKAGSIKCFKICMNQFFPLNVTNENTCTSKSKIGKLHESLSIDDKFLFPQNTVLDKLLTVWFSPNRFVRISTNNLSLVYIHLLAW